MSSILSKFLTLTVFIRYPKIKGQYRWFIRFRILGKFIQLRYFVKDYIIRKPYKKIVFKGEFQQELIHVLPFAYWHFKNGTLSSTESTNFTNEFYFFSKNHSEIDGKRDYQDNFNLEIPNAPHDVKLTKSKWDKVPFKTHFKNNIFVYEKPILIIANRYNTEWNQQPISFLDLETLDEIILASKSKYQIIYNRPPAREIVGDNSEVLDLNDENWLNENHSEVILMTDLFDKHFPDGIVKSYNHLQLLTYANCDNFISVHGGTATLASYFSGKNIIYSVEGHEHYLNEFENIFPELSNASIFHVKNYNSLMVTLKNEFLVA